MLVIARSDITGYNILLKSTVLFVIIITNIYCKHVTNEIKIHQ